VEKPLPTMVKALENKRPLPINGKGLKHKRPLPVVQVKVLLTTFVANKAESLKLRNDDFVVKATPL